MSAPASFWLYLEASGPGERARRTLAREGEEAISEARDFWSGRVIGAGIFRQEIEEALGRADRSEEDRLLYLNPARPHHAYAFGFDNRRLIESGYVRVGTPLTPPPDESWPRVVAHLLAEEATADEVQHWLGDPLEISGWWPVETWDYGDDLLLDLRHGIVEDLAGG